MEPKETNFAGSLKVPNVQELSKECLSSVPSRYIRPHQDPPFISSVSSNPQLPIIDMERLMSSDFMHSELQKLHLACKDWGFFQLINHEVRCSLVERVKEETQQFFKLPLHEKSKYEQKEGDLEGLGQHFVVSEEQKLDWADMFYILTLPTNIRNPHLLPKLPQPFRDTLDDYSKAMEKVALKTLMFIGKALNMEDEEMKSLFENGLQMMRMNYYPPCPQPEQVIGLNPHSDGMGITFLLQVNHVEGLQIKKDDVWIPVTPLPGAFIVNVGDIIQIISNGIYKSIEHRAVVNSNKERLSIATFLSPNLESEIGPALSLITPGTPAKFTRITTVDYMKKFYSRELNGKSNVEQYYI
uniref:protein SRG1-like n=1 Tax=Erigeron canadensis TaxID=72917 RepID=UPI001CB9292C|nr:protein SRG1-like [Erigeron canadensis]